MGTSKLLWYSIEVTDVVAWGRLRVNSSRRNKSPSCCKKRCKKLGKALSVVWAPFPMCRMNFCEKIEEFMADVDLNEALTVLFKSLFHLVYQLFVCFQVSCP